MVATCAIHLLHSICHVLNFYMDSPSPLHSYETANAKSPSNITTQLMWDSYTTNSPSPQHSYTTMDMSYAHWHSSHILQHVVFTNMNSLYNSCHHYCKRETYNSKSADHFVSLGFLALLHSTSSTTSGSVLGMKIRRNSFSLSALVLTM
jgi:hypothetical protein